MHIEVTLSSRGAFVIKPSHHAKPINRWMGIKYSNILLLHWWTLASGPGGQNKHRGSFGADQLHQLHGSAWQLGLVMVDTSSLIAVGSKRISPEYNPLPGKLEYT